MSPMTEQSPSPTTERLTRVTAAMQQAWAAWDPGFEPEPPLSPRQAVFVRSAFMDGYATSTASLQAEIAELRGKLRMIVAHATGGASDDIDRSVNDICVAISANRNHIYEAGKDAARTLLNKDKSNAN